MAANYTCTNFPHNNKTYLILQTKASNIKLVSLYREKGQCETVKNSGYYGMNASFFNPGSSSVRPYAIHNIALQDGKSTGVGKTYPDWENATDGTVNLAGNSVICWSGSKLSCLNGVRYSTAAGVPQLRNTWAQGGFGLHLCDKDWQKKFAAELSAEEYPFTASAARTGILINKSTNYVYLFVCTSSILISALRSAMMAYAGLTEGGSAGNWAAIMTDGGLSAQLYTEEKSAAVVMARKVPQIIALKNID